MSDTHNDADRRFARALFTRSDDPVQEVDEPQELDDDRADDRRFAVDLFAHHDGAVLAGLAAGRTAGRWTPPKRDPVSRSAFNFS